MLRMACSQLIRKIIKSLLIALFSSTVYAQVIPILQIPQPGIDDTAFYNGYITRFYRDSDGNIVQVYIDNKSGRVVHLWANAMNESIGFTIRGSRGNKVKINLGDEIAKTYRKGEIRYFEYIINIESGIAQIGHFLLGSMRVERDFQYLGWHLKEFSEKFFQKELLDLIRNIERLPEEIKRAHLKILKTSNTNELRQRLQPIITLNESEKLIKIEQSTFDGNNHLWLEIFAKNNIDFKISPEKIQIISKDRKITLGIRISRDSPSLTPLKAEQIFNDDFMSFYNEIRSKYGENSIQFKWLERQVVGIELLCYKEKLMAGLPNFATYFGRDVIMFGLMMEPLLSVDMIEHIIESVLNKLNQNGKVSHEESLGGQAIRESANEYNFLIEKYFEYKNKGLMQNANLTIKQAEDVLANMQRTRENYFMVDDDFQLPILFARYISRDDISNERKYNFLTKIIGGRSNLELILLNLAHVLSSSIKYVVSKKPVDLVRFPSCMSASWRDSRVGYGGGCYAMDVNVVWVPEAIRSIITVFEWFGNLGFSIDTLKEMFPWFENSELFLYLNDGKLKLVADAWSDTYKHFIVKISAEEVNKKINEKLAWLPEIEGRYWKTVWDTMKNDFSEGIEFLCLSLDSNGNPVKIMNSDISSVLFVRDMEKDFVLSLVKILTTPYPVGLFVKGLGVLCANDCYESKKIWEDFKNDRYHSPFVVWGREMNLIFLGLIRQIKMANKIGDGSYVNKLRQIFNDLYSAVEMSGLKHAELWTYRITDGKLNPIRYPTGSDVQLWSFTNLAVEFYIEKLKLR